MNKSISSPRCLINHALTLCCYLFSGVVLQGFPCPAYQPLHSRRSICGSCCLPCSSRRGQHSRRFRSLRAPANAGATAHGLASPCRGGSCRRYLVHTLPNRSRLHVGCRDGLQSSGGCGHASCRDHRHNCWACAGRARGALAGRSRRCADRPRHCGHSCRRREGARCACNAASQRAGGDAGRMSWLSLCAALPCWFARVRAPMDALGRLGPAGLYHLRLPSCGFGNACRHPRPDARSNSIGHQWHHAHHRRGLYHRFHHGRCAHRNTHRRAIVPGDRARSSAAA